MTTCAGGVALGCDARAAANPRKQSPQCSVGGACAPRSGQGMNGARLPRGSRRRKSVLLLLFKRVVRPRGRPSHMRARPAGAVQRSRRTQNHVLSLRMAKTRVLQAENAAKRKLGATANSINQPAQQPLH